MRRAPGGIEPVTSALTTRGQSLDFDVNTRIGQHPKVYWRAAAQSGASLKIKIEIVTNERVQALPLQRLPYGAESSWWSGTADVMTYQLEELVATKIRALYQRSKGRDVFDLWLALEHLALDPTEILAVFESYRPHALTRRAAIANLRQKLTNPGFRDDIIPLVRELPKDYDVDRAAEMIIDQLLTNLG